MTTYRIEFKKQAVKFLKTRTVREQQKLLSEIYRLPDGNNTKKMEGYNNRYRLRVGDIRVIYDKVDNLLLILILEIGNRGDVYK